MKFDARGCPIVDLPTKLSYLKTCFDHLSYEDCAGHLCDLLAYVGEKLRHSDSHLTLTELVKFYGDKPTPIE